MGLPEISLLPLSIGILLVVISFVSSGGWIYYIETLGILEETHELEREDAIGLFTAPP